MSYTGLQPAEIGTRIGLCKYMPELDIGLLRWKFMLCVSYSLSRTADLWLVRLVRLVRLAPANVTPH